MARNKSVAIVKSTKVAQHEKHVRFVGSAETGPMILPRFAPLAKNDQLYFSGVRKRSIWVESSDQPGKRIKILPTFQHAQQIRLGAHRLTLELFEITNKEEYEAYLDLERFHYRSSPSLIEQEETSESRGGGRKGVIMASLMIGQKKTYVGYIELTMPLMMVAPRHKAFARPFKHSTRKIQWTKWDQNSLKENLNIIVRIARVVTHPTFRGLGLSHKLIEGAEKYSAEHWHIGNRTPIFMEISAEMLNYFDFVSGCGFTYCGHSEGNQKRIAKDMRAMAQGQKITSGIMTLQNKYFGVLSNFAEHEKISLNKAIKLVEDIAESENPESCVDETSWLMLRKLFRQPRPYFVKGLDKDARRYLKGVNVEHPSRSEEKVNKKNPSVTISDLVVKAIVDLPKSENIKVIKDSFGLDGSEITQSLLKIDEFRAIQGNVFLLAGASGTGKSIFLDILGHKDRFTHNNIDISFANFEVSKTAVLEKIDPESIVIDYFATKYGLTKSLKTLAITGLSEAVPLVKPFWMLSKGQKYRALLADLILTDADIWLLDEYGADLDPITAAILASKLRTLADKLGVIIFLAAANNGHFYRSLRPTRVITFDLGMKPKLKTMMEYKNEFL